MGVLQNVIREIGDIVNRLSVSSKEKQKIQEEIQSLVYRYKSELVREQSAAVGGRSPGKLVAEVLASYRDVGVRVGDFVGDVHGIDVVVR